MTVHSSYLNISLAGLSNLFLYNFCTDWKGITVPSYSDAPQVACTLKLWNSVTKADDYKFHRKFTGTLLIANN